MKKIGLTLREDQARERRDCLDQEWYQVLVQNGLWPVPLPPCCALCIPRTEW